VSFEKIFQGYTPRPILKEEGKVGHEGKEGEEEEGRGGEGRTGEVPHRFPWASYSPG
jgi:hypothetical protein